MNYRSKTFKLIDSVRSDIVKGRFKSEPFLPSEQRLASYYDASRHTIRRITENLIGEKLLVREENHRLRVNPDEISLSVPPMPEPEEQTQTLAWAYAAYPDTMISAVTAGIRDYAEEHHLNLRLFASGTEHEQVLRSIENARELGVGGLIILPYYTPEYIETINKVTAAGISAVTISRLPGTVNCSSVAGDDYDGAFQAIQYLIERYDRPAYLLGPVDETSSSMDRESAFEQAMRDAGFESEIESHKICLAPDGIKPEHWSMEEKLSHPADLIFPFLSRFQLPASVFCINDYIAQGLYQAAERANLKPGIDFKIIGVGDLPMARRLSPSLATVKCDSHQVGYQAAFLVHRLIKKEISGKLSLKIPVNFIKRESCL